MSQQLELNCTRDELAQTILRLDGNVFSLRDFPFYKDVYNAPRRWILMKCGRQVAKSTTACNDVCLDAFTTPHFRQLYVAPLRVQSQKFSKTRLGKVIRNSPDLKRMFPSNVPVWDVYGKNESEIYISYAGDDPDRIRGISTDSNKYDEVQDMVYDLVIPVLNETMSMSKYAYEYYAGTPKSQENTVEWLWQQSTQCEWMMKCPGCNTYNYADGAKSVGRTGIICVRCGRNLNPREGFWQPMNYNKERSYETQKWGFHINKLILPENNESLELWDRRVLRPMEDYPEDKFLNEVLGVSVASGSRLLDREDLIAMCRDYDILETPHPELYSDLLHEGDGTPHVYAGIDWSGEGEKSVSLTALWIFGVTLNGKLKTMYFEIFPKGEPVRNVKRIAQLCRAYRVKHVGADAGVGAHANSFLREALGHGKLTQFQYGAFKQQFAQSVDRIYVDRTAVIDTFFSMVKRKEVYYPRQTYCREPFNHMLSLFAEVTQQGSGRKIWNSTPMAPNDALHAQVFAWMAADITRGKIKLYATPDERDRDMFTEFSPHG